MLPRIDLLLLLFGLVIADEYHRSARSLKEDGQLKNTIENEEDAEDGQLKNSIENEEDAEFWMKEGEKELNESLCRKENRNIAKNIVLFIGDGMSIPTVTGIRIYKNQKQGGLEKGVKEKLEWEKKLTNVALSRTYNSDMMVTDSAASAFAMYSGVKTVDSTMGYDSSVELRNASSMLTATPVDTVLSWAQAAGWATGIVTTARVTHATPAALYARTAHRDWECDSEMVNGADAADFVPDGVKDIAKQLVENEVALNTKIILGGGMAPFIGTSLDDQSDSVFETYRDFDYSKNEFDCPRNDGRNLLKDWSNKTRSMGRKGTIVKNKSQLDQLENLETDQVLGLFSWSHMPFHDQHNSSTDIPTLAEMTGAAVDFLQSKSEEKGFFLMVESARIDMGHHDGTAIRALNEGVALDDAVAMALSKVDLEDTLVIVTADHAHTFTVGGDTGREVDITGVVRDQNGKIDKAEDGKPFPILSYGNGKGFMELEVNQTAIDNGVLNWTAVSRDGGNILTDDITGRFTYLQPSGIPLHSETHGADDVGIWAGGPMAHLFHGVHQQTHIGHVMSLAGCIGPHKNYPRCLEKRQTEPVMSNPVARNWEAKKKIVETRGG